jgi:hypothetical protein
LTQTVDIEIAFVDEQLKPEQLTEEVRYLIDDLRDLGGMSQVRFAAIPDIRDGAEVEVGVSFEVELERLGAILRRLRDRLYYSPIETAFAFQLDDISLRIHTHQADDLLGLMDLCQSGLLLAPERDYLAEAETYSRTQGELSPTELDTLGLRAQRLGLSAERAEQLNARAAGPFRTLGQKRRHFDEITQAEFSRLRAMDDGLPFATKDIWPVLQDLAEGLGLPLTEAEATYQQHHQLYQGDRALQREQAAVKTAEDERLAAEAQAERDRQAQAQQTQERLDQYRALCRQAMATGLYPSEYDQGRLDQAWRLRGLSQAEALGLEAAARAELYGPVDSEAGVDYRRLRLLLHQGQWQSADLETEVAILTAIGPAMEPATAATVQRVPSVDLATIDALWSRYSKGRFGFRAQQQVYRGLQNIKADDDKGWLDFQVALGWREPPTWVYRGFKAYGDLTFGLGAPPGHLPTWRWACPHPGHRYSLSPDLLRATLDHLNRSLPPEAAVPALDPTLLAGGLANA